MLTCSNRTGVTCLACFHLRVPSSLDMCSMQMGPHYQTHNPQPPTIMQTKPCKSIQYEWVNAIVWDTMNLNLCAWEYESVLTEGLFPLAHPISCSSEYPKRHPIKATRNRKYLWSCDQWWYLRWQTEKWNSADKGGCPLLNKPESCHT